MNRRTLRSYFYVVVLTVLSFQFFSWRSYLVTGTWYQLKDSIGLLDDVDRLDQAAICNSLKKLDCSANNFSILVSKYPHYPPVLANYGIVLAMQGKYQKSLVYFKEYFQNRGRGYDVMYWYAVALNQLKLKNEASEWLYKAITLNPSHFESAVLLVDLLMELNQVDEAMSLVGYFSVNLPDEQNYWIGKQELIEKMIITDVSKQRQNDQVMKIPSIDGYRHYVPLRMEPNGKSYLFQMEEGEDKLEISKEMLNDIYRNQLGEKRWLSSAENFAKNIDTVHFSKIYIGPWYFEEVTATICEKCQAKLGSQILKQIQMKKTVNNVTDFLILSKNKKEEEKNEN